MESANPVYRCRVSLTASTALAADSFPSRGAPYYGSSTTTTKASCCEFIELFWPSALNRFPLVGTEALGVQQARQYHLSGGCGRTDTREFPTEWIELSGTVARSTGPASMGFYFQLPV